MSYKNTASAPQKEQTQQKDQQNSATKKRKFEIAVYDENLRDDGQIELKAVPMTEPLYIEAETKEEFAEIINTYKQCGQQVKILREIDPQPRLQTQNKPKVISAQIGQVQQEIQPERRKPVVFKVGDVEVKEDNGKIFQKQWMRLTDKEAANFRIVNTSNNKIVNLNGKHIEMKRWVEVKNSEDDIGIEGELENDN